MPINVGDHVNIRELFKYSNRIVHLFGSLVIREYAKQLYLPAIC